MKTKHTKKNLLSRSTNESRKIKKTQSRSSCCSSSQFFVPLNNNIDSVPIHPSSSTAATPTHVNDEKAKLEEQNILLVVYPDAPHEQRERQQQQGLLPPLNLVSSSPPLPESSSSFVVGKEDNDRILSAVSAKTNKDKDGQQDQLRIGIPHHESSFSTKSSGHTILLEDFLSSCPGKEREKFFLRRKSFESPSSINTSHYPHLPSNLRDPFAHPLILRSQSWVEEKTKSTTSDEYQVGKEEERKASELNKANSRKKTTKSPPNSQREEKSVKHRDEQLLPDKGDDVKRRKESQLRASPSLPLVTKLPRSTLPSILTDTASPSSLTTEQKAFQEEDEVTLVPSLSTSLTSLLHIINSIQVADYSEEEKDKEIEATASVKQQDRSGDKEETVNSLTSLPSSPKKTLSSKDKDSLILSSGTDFDEEEPPRRQGGDNHSSLPRSALKDSSSPNLHLSSPSACPSFNVSVDVSPPRENYSSEVTIEGSTSAELRERCSSTSDSFSPSLSPLEYQEVSRVTLFDDCILSSPSSSMPLVCQDKMNTRKSGEQKHQEVVGGGGRCCCSLHSRSTNILSSSTSTSITTSSPPPPDMDSSLHDYFYDHDPSKCPHLRGSRHGPSDEPSVRSDKRLKYNAVLDRLRKFAVS